MPRAYYVAEKNPANPRSEWVAVGEAGNLKAQANGMGRLWLEHRKRAGHTVIVRVFPKSALMRSVYAFDEQALEQDVEDHKPEFDQVTVGDYAGQS